MYTEKSKSENTNFYNYKEKYVIYSVNSPVYIKEIDIMS